jgi:hypothetical protein
MQSNLGRAATIGGVILMLAAPVPALADSIYLKNGRVIRVAEARIDGDRVVFHLHGGEQAIPLALVERVENDDWRGPGAPPGAAGLEALIPLIGALGGGDGSGVLGGGRGSGVAGGDDGSGALGGLGSLGADLQQMQTILPVLTRLGAALFAPEYSAEATDAAARDLLQALARIGVPEAEVRARARQLGVPEELLDGIGRR